MRAAWFSPRIFADIQRFQPDIIQVFEEFSSFIAFQTLLVRNLCCRRSKIMIYAAENIPGNVGMFFRLPMRYVMRYSDLAFVCSQGVKHVLQAEGYSHPIDVFPLGVDTGAFQKCDSPQLKRDLALDGKFVLGYVGRLLRIKGVFDILDIMRTLPETVHLLVIGSGPEESTLKATATQNGLSERVHIAGDVPYEKLPGYMNCMDLGIVPSRTTPRWKEQFGRVLVEFMSCEVPVIGSNSGSIPEVLGNTGCIFPEGDTNALRDTIEHLLAHPEKRDELSRRGRARVKRCYSLEIMYQHFEKMYNSLYTES
jgi:glycosyltransferase involved in cell wall biosynthesis